MSEADRRRGEEPEEPFVRGRFLVSRIEYLRTRHGPDAVGRVLAHLTSEDRGILAELASVGWYRFTLLGRLDRAIAEEYAPGDPSVFEELGSWLARHHTTWLGDDAGLVSVHTLLARLAEEHRRFHSFGRAEYVRLGFHSGEFRSYGHPQPEETFCRSSVGFLRHCVRVLSGPGVAVTETDCQCRGGAACVFRLDWS